MTDKMPIIDADELNTVHNAYLREVRIATACYGTDRGRAIATVREAQRVYKAWFAERGVILEFPPEE